MTNFNHSYFVWVTAKYHLTGFLVFLCLAFCFLCGSFSYVAAQSFPSGFSQVAVHVGLTNPTVMAFAPDGRLFVAEQAGKLRIIKNGTLLATPFLQLSVNANGERGLIGLAFDPGFNTNKYIYVYYTVPSGSYNRISRFTANGDVVVTGSEKVILNLDPLSGATNHNGGAMHFGIDGKLYVAIGENASPEKAQNMDTYHGKLLRINPDGTVPAGNPYTSGTEQKKRIWASGLRNPFTFSVEPGTGKIYVNDVGQTSWEEINNASVGGRNFGWPRNEGKTTNTAYTSPVYTYQRIIGAGNEVGCAITGGTFFRPASTNYPLVYRGRYFFQDYCNGWISMLDFSNGLKRLPFATGLSGRLLSITAGRDGNLYYLNRSNGTVYKIIYNMPNTPPSIANQPDNLTISEGQTASFTVSASGSAPLTYQWQKNGVNISGATSTTYTLASTKASDAGQYRVIVKNAVGTATSNAATLTVTAFNTAPVATIISPASGTLYTAGQSISFSGSATDKEDGALPASAFTWEVVFHHDTHTHDGPPVAVGVKSGSYQIPNSGEIDPDVWYRLYLTVTDSKGLAHKIYRDIYPRKSVISFKTEPANLKVILDGQTKNTPSGVTSVEGLLRTINAGSTQTLNGSTYVFHSWAHGGSQQQTITTPVSDVTYTARFSRVPENPAATVNGLTYAYYEGSWSSLPDFNNITPVKTGTISTFNLSPRNRNGYFAFRFTGYVSIPRDGVYTFYTNSDDGSQLFIGNTLVVNNNGTHAAQERSGSIRLKTGKHAITVTYFEQTGEEKLEVYCEGPEVTKKLIPGAALYRTTTSAIAAKQGELETELNQIKVYPNPATEVLNIDFRSEQPGQAEIIVTDVLSQKVYTKTQPVVAGENKLALQTQGWKSGTYLLQIYQEGKRYTQKISIIK